MGVEVEACAECSRNCLLIHQKNDPSLVVFSFFKVMFGKHFSDVVIVPPRFARLTSLVPKETYLEDSSGQKWKVILSDYNDSLAIRKGWSEFLEDHGIQQGDFVVFHYITGSHFVVQTYGHHGCEKLSLSAENTYQNKKPKTNENSTPTNLCAAAQPETDDTQMQNDVINVEEQLVPPDGVPSQVKTTKRPKVHGYQNEKAKTNENSTPTNSCAAAQPETDDTQMQNDVINMEEQLVPPDGVSSQVKTTKRPKLHTSDFSDDTQFVTNQDNFARQYDRDYLFDLSVFETPNKSVDPNKLKLHVQGYTCSQVFDALQNAEFEDASNSTTVEKKCQTAEGNKLSNRKEASMSRRECNPSCTSPKVGGRVGVVKQNSKLYSQDFKGQTMAEASLRIMQQEPLGSNMPHESVGLPQNTEFSAGVKVGLVKQEPREFSQNSSRNVVADTSVGISGKEARTIDKDLCENLNYMSDDDGDPAIMVKPEPVDFYDCSSASITKMTCLVQPGSESFLELPEGLPMKATGQVSKFQPKLVLLQDQLRRVWPVLYHHRKYGVNVLASGWKALNEANDIRPGDECTFLVENVDEGRFLVQILRRNQRPGS